MSTADDAIQEPTLTSSEPAAGQPTASHLSKEGLARLHDSMAAHVAAVHMPGLVALVARGGAVHVDAIGSPSWEEPKGRAPIVPGP
jgi:hypothetical protein